MSTDLRDAFVRASHVAQTEFETRNAADVIEPAARRVARHRVALRLGTGVASVAVVAAALWGADAVANARVATLDPAHPNPGTYYVTGDPNPDVAAPASAWSTLDLAVRAKPRQLGNLSVDATAGAICHHVLPTDDPRIAAAADGSTVNHRTAIEDCTAVWFVNGPASTLTNWSVSASKLDHSLTYSFAIHNVSTQSIAIDSDSVFMWIETNPDQPSDTAATYSSAVVGGSMWDSAGDVTALLDSRAEPLTIAAGGDYSSAITATTGSADDDPLAAVLASGEPYRVSLWARVHEASPSGDATYLIQLGSNNDASWSLSGEGKVP